VITALPDRPFLVLVTNAANTEADRSRHLMIGVEIARLKPLMSPRIVFHNDAESAAEDYLMERMPTDQIPAYEFHVRCCSTCANEVEVTRAMIDALRVMTAERGDFRYASRFLRTQALEAGN